jgi:CRP-like cAMP-binding protein
MPDVTQPSHAQGNRLLAALPASSWQRVAPHLELVALSPRRPLCDSGQVLSHAYFPSGALISLMYLSANGATAESAVVGKEGMVGVSLLLGGGSTCSRAVVQTAGAAYRVPADVVQQEFNRAGAAMKILLRYMQALLTQTAQHAVCFRHHTVAQQFSRCLLQSLDCNRGADLLMTQEAIAERLGVRRESITGCACRLQRQGLIRYTRGHISLLDRCGLERQACECYGIVKSEYQRLLPGPLAVAKAAKVAWEPLAA